jgi:hypothetical protein
MKFIPIQQAKSLNYDDTYLVELKDGTHALGQLVSVQKNHKTFRVVSFNNQDNTSHICGIIETADVVKVAKLPKKSGKEDAVDPETLTNTVQ